MQEGTRVQYEKNFEKEIGQLNEGQLLAVKQIDGPVMVIAGPGTGKTQILAARIGEILRSDQQIGPHNILCLTYTDAGTVAMRNRLLQFIGPTAYRVNIYTFHAFCNDIIQHNLELFGKKEMQPISDLEVVQVIREILDELASDHPLKRLAGSAYYDVPRLRDLFRIMKEEDWSPEFISSEIDRYIADLPLRDEYIYKRASKNGHKPGDIKQDDINKEKEKMNILRSGATLFPVYTTKLKKIGRYDYSDMILWVLNAFKTNEDLLRKYQEWYQYFLVDEFQDTSGAQNELLQLLIDFWEKPNVFVVGDDDQCIYEFQGARVKNMTRFFEKFEKEIEVIVLKHNYRSTQPILDAAKSVIDHNRQRLVHQPPLLRKIPALTKTLLASKKSSETKPSLPTLTEYHNTLHEEAAVVEAIQKLQKEGVPLNEIAVLYAKHRQIENIQSLLEKKGIPYSARKRIDILELPLVRQIINLLTYLDLESRRPNSGEHLLFEIMHYRFMGIDPRDAAKIATHCGRNRLRWREQLGRYEELKQLNLVKYPSVMFFEENLTQWIQSVANETLQGLFERLLNWSGLLKQVLGSDEKIQDLQIITTFFDFLKSECIKQPHLQLKDFLLMISQMKESGISLAINKTVYIENGVQLITAHSAKGLEFGHVFLIGCVTDAWEKSRGGQNQFSLPDTLTQTQTLETEDAGKVESTRRLFYVALTRAKDHLYISFSSATTEGKKLEKTRYLEELASQQGIPIVRLHLSDETLTGYTGLLLKDVPKPREHIVSLEKEHLAAILEKFEMTATHLNKYLECPISFYYDMILRVPSAKSPTAAYGTAVHDSLKWLFTEMKERGKEFPEQNEFITQFRYFLTRQRDAFTDIEFKNRIAYGEQSLPAYYQQYVQTWNRNVLCEFNINHVEVDGVPINGNLDKIEFIDKNTVNVVDYKTGKPSNGKAKTAGASDKNPEGGNYWRQLVFYKILLDNFKRENWNMISGEIDFVEKENVRDSAFLKVKINIQKEDEILVRNQIKETYTKIKNLEFENGCNEPDCKWCNFNNTIL